MRKKQSISIIIPVYNEEKSLSGLCQQLKEELTKLNHPYELIFVDDGSSDSSLNVLKKVHAKDEKVKIISFRKNFGKSVALAAGFKEATGELVFTLDADLQDKPDQIPRFLAEISQKDYDLVCGWRYNRKDRVSKIFASLIFNKVTSFLTGTYLHDMNCGFKVFKREAAKALKIYGELHRFIPVLAQWQGFKVGELKIKHSRRRFGKSKYGLKKPLGGLFDLLTVMFLTRYLSKPLHVFGSIGLLSFSLGSSIILFFEFRKFLFGILIGAGRPIIQVATFLMMFGVQFFVLGFLAEIIISDKNKDFKDLIKEKIE